MTAFAAKTSTKALKVLLGLLRAPEGLQESEGPVKSFKQRLKGFSKVFKKPFVKTFERAYKGL